MVGFSFSLFSLLFSSLFAAAISWEKALNVSNYKENKFQTEYVSPIVIMAAAKQCMVA